MDRETVTASFEALKANTPANHVADFGRMMLMSREGDDCVFKHSDMRRSFGFNAATGAFSGQDAEGEITTAEEAYRWARS